ncbi:helix-turn-helix domain-containing protein [Nocardia otitidiscaviarum]|uniref:helix-turn-helix domain-containing protein n=1 Tax=Nocardia otitidiscaviarum TaxID=1823 RepID=UPI0018947B5C|nr:helix-turn-helix transcriptional regulator [Nocardia otitidiscaviarum]MBF6239115.1 helix-turn-helix domain-containing protein [Nocardia otitidiscaviarum]
MTDSVKQAREALGERLRGLRLAAGLSGSELARRAGWHQTRVPKIEYGRTKPSEADIRTWCSLTGTESEIPDLVATLRNIDAAYREWRRTLSGGTKQKQHEILRMMRQSAIMRVYQPSLIPGLLQTTEYAYAILRRSIRFHNIPDDLDEGVSKRMERQQILYQGERRFHILMGELALYNSVGGDSIMLGQLDRLLATTVQPRVSFGIVPMDTELPMQLTNFVMFDERRVTVETISAELTISQPREIRLYHRTFDTLAKKSMYGSEARALIQRAINARVPSSTQP